ARSLADVPCVVGIVACPADVVAVSVVVGGALVVSASRAVARAGSAIPSWSLPRVVFQAKCGTRRCVEDARAAVERAEREPVLGHRIAEVRARIDAAARLVDDA